MHFNNLFEEMRHMKEREMKCAKERIDRLRYCAFELKTMFGVDSLLEPIEIPIWNVEEIHDYVVTVQDHEIFKKQARPGESKTEIGSPETEENEENGKKNRKSNDFYIKVLQEMMDGVLEAK